ncbi:MAG TPA: hypothetical protein VGJ28_13120 [Micromonosporaceae bacterium]|jgi:hypothetical protein
MDAMVGFGPKQAWLAIRDTEPEAVIAALGLQDLGPVGWRLGIDLAHQTDDRPAVTPLLPGAGAHDWVLVAGQRFLHTDPRVAALSETLRTEVQLFSTYRVDERHRWQRAVDGVMVRAFDYVGRSGEIALWWGDPDEHERALGLPETEPDNDELDIILDETDVMRLAAAWSIDPTSLDGKPAPGPLRSAAAQRDT